MDEQPVTALSGYRVLDLTDEPGMLAAKVLADMGAGVVRVEKPGPRPADAGYAYLNAGKRSVSLDMEHPEGQALFRRLVRESDVLVTTAAPGHLEARGLGYADLSKVNRGLVMAAITGFGQSGPYRDYHSSDLVAAALGGWLSVSGGPEMPLQLYGEQAYATASLFAANGVMLALWHRHATGRGQLVDISVMECVAATLDHALVRYLHEGSVPRRTGSRHWNGAFRVLPCRDGHILISLFQHWDRLVAWLESEGMAGDLAGAEWRDRERRLRGADHIAAVLEKWTRNHAVAELVEQGQLLRFPWAAVTTVADLLSGPQLAARGFFKEMGWPEAGDRGRAPGAPVRFT